MKKLYTLLFSILLLTSCGNTAQQSFDDSTAAPLPTTTQNTAAPTTSEAVTASTPGVVSITSSGTNADEALKLLMAGNERFAKGDKLVNLTYNESPTVRESLAKGQTPFAIILTCSDSRLPPELIFDQGLGQIFVIRVAGNIVSPHELGTIEYGIEHLGAKLIMVLGHEKCGAVKATYGAVKAGTKVEGNLGSLVTDIEPAVKKVLAESKATTDEEKVEECVLENINLVGEALETKSPVIKEFVEKEGVKIVKAKYDLDDGKVTLLGGEAKEGGETQKAETSTGEAKAPEAPTATEPTAPETPK